MISVFELLRIFDWFRLHAHIQISNPTPVYPSRREIWWIYLGQNIGVETNGKNHNFERPALVLKVFNSHSLLIAPLTTQAVKGKYLFTFTDSTGTAITVNTSQMRTISSKRLLRKSEAMSESDFNEVILQISKYIFTKETPAGVSSGSPQGDPNGTETQHSRISSAPPLGGLIGKV